MVVGRTGGGLRSSLRAKTLGGIACAGLAVALGWFAVGALRPFVADVGLMFSDILVSPAQPVPGEFVEELLEGSYLVAVRTSSSSSTGPLTVVRSVDVEVTDIEVVGPGGESVELRSGRGNSIQRNGVGFSGVALFDVEQRGQYRVSVSSTADTDAIVVRSFVAPDRQAFIGYVVGLCSVLVGFAALGLLLSAVIDRFFGPQGASTSGPA